MTRLSKIFIRGMGSVLEVWPAPRQADNYTRLPPSHNHAIGQHWENAGKYIWNAMGQVKDEQRKK